jgi:predicted phage terminase large subunit-like protein
MTDKHNILNELHKLPVAEVNLTVKKNLYEKSFYHFFVGCTTAVYKNVKWIYPPFYRYVCDRLQYYAENYINGHKKIKDIILTLPYRSGKSTILECYKAWLWTRSLNIDILSISATSPLAVKSNRNVKRIIESEWYQSMWSTKFAKDQKAKGSYNNENNASMIGIGVKSSAVGKDASLLCIDDPNEPQSKNATKTAFTNVIDRFRDVLYSRLNEPTRGYRVICQQRVDAEDLTGWILKNHGGTVENICLPVKWNKYATSSLRHLYDAEGYLWRERYTTEYLKECEDTMTPNAVASQLYASASAIEGSSIMKLWFDTILDSQFKRLGAFKTFLFVDGAYTSDKMNNDPTAYYVCTLINKRIYVLDVIQDWLEWNDNVEFIKELILKYSIKEVIIEKKANGISLIQELRRQIPRTSIVGIDPASKSKGMRAKLTQPYLSNHNVILVQGSWNDMFKDQCASFDADNPRGHDDMVDCLVYSVIYLLINRYSVNAIKQAGLNIIKDGKTWEEKNSYLNNKSDNYYYD